MNAAKPSAHPVTASLASTRRSLALLFGQMTSPAPGHLPDMEESDYNDATVHVIEIIATCAAYLDDAGYEADAIDEALDEARSALMGLRERLASTPDPAPASESHGPG